MNENTPDAVDILVVDDEIDIRDGSERVLTRMGYQVHKAGRGEEALEMLKKQPVSIILLDLKMPGIDGMEVLKRVHKIDSNILVIIITGFATIETAIEAMKEGAYDFITKPFEPEPLRLVVRRAHDKILLVRETDKLEQERRRTLLDLNTEKSRIRTIVESLPNGVIVTNTGGQIVLMNQAILSLLELSPNQAYGEHIQTYLPDEGFRDLVTDISHRKYTKSNTPSSYELTLTNEKVLLAEGKSIFGENKECLGAVITFVDITALKNLDRLKSEFIAEVSHELRSPLATIYEELAIVTKGMITEKFSQDQHILARALDKTQGLIALIGDLLDLSRIEAGHTFEDVKPVHIDELLKNILDFLHIKAKDRDQKLDLKLSSDSIPSVTADPLALESVFGNLITNAIKYTPEGGEITVTVGLVGKKIRVTVKDNGFGIEEKHLEKIFDRFYRIKNQKTRYITGTGLGLPIVKEILYKLGGSIRVNSLPGKGSTFTVLLPT